VSERVVDASVVLAILKSERLAPAVWKAMEGAILSSVNLEEVLAKAFDYGMSESKVLGEILGMLSRIEPFTETHARRAAGLRRRTKEFGLSLGDRACLALALELGAEVYTADQAWAQVEVGCVVHLIREPRDSVQ
jgi:PIN domain nuclease of toxin-antitoxin system